MLHRMSICREGRQQLQQLHIPHHNTPHIHPPVHPLPQMSAPLLPALPHTLTHTLILPSPPPPYLLRYIECRYVERDVNNYARRLKTQLESYDNELSELRPLVANQQREAVDQKARFEKLQASKCTLS